MKRRLAARVSGIMLLLNLLASAPALAAPDEQIRAALEKARAAAVAQLTASAQAGATLKAAAEPCLSALDTEMATTRQALEQRERDLVRIAAGGDATAVKRAQTLISTAQLQIDAAESEKALWQKQLEEVGRDREAWQKRLASLDTAGRLDTIIMVTTPADAADRDKKVDAAARDVEYQQSQVRKYISRRESAQARAEDFQDRLDQARQRAEEQDPELAKLRQAELVQLERNVRVQQNWFLLNRQQEERARRNLSFARLELSTRETMAAALARKQMAWQLIDRQAQAAGAEAALDRLAAGVKASLTDAERRLTADAAETQQALTAIGAAANRAAETAAQADYEAARQRHAALEAEKEFLKERQSLEKARAAFAREKADRIRSLLEARTLAQIRSEQDMLTESARTSEEYVLSFATILQKLADQIQALRQTPSSATSNNLPDAIRTIPGLMEYSPETTMTQLVSQVTAPSPDPASVELALRTAQQVLVQERLRIAKEWLEGTREQIRRFNDMAAATMWEPTDPRLTDHSIREAADLARTVWSDALFAADALKLGVAPAAGYTSPRRLSTGLGLILILAVIAGFQFRRSLESSLRPIPWLLRRMAVTIPFLVAAALMARAFPDNLFARLLALTLLGSAIWYAARTLMLAGFADHRFPARRLLAGGFLLAIRMILATAMILGIAHLLANSAPNSWDLQAITSHLWMFFLCLAVFRLLHHPVLLGRFFSAHSEHAGLRFAGTCVALACVTVLALAAIPFLFSLTTMGQRVLHTVIASLVPVFAGGAIVTLCMLLLKHTWPQWHWAALGRQLVRLVVAGVIGLMLWRLWGKLLQELFFAPSTPDAVQAVVHFAARGWHACDRFWNAEMTGGMTVGSLFRGLVVFVLSFWVAKAVKRIFVERVLSRTPMDEMTRQSFAAILGYIIVVIGFLVGLNVAGSSLKNLALLAGAITVGIGFGLQNIINNFVSSLLIHFSRTIRIGDYIEVGGVRGAVHDIGLRCTTVRTDDGVTVLIPNGSLVGSAITNWTNPTRRLRLRVPVTVARQADLAVVSRALADLAIAHPQIVPHPAPSVEVRTVAADKMTLELLAWTERPEQAASILGELSLTIDQHLRECKLAV